MSINLLDEKVAKTAPAAKDENALPKIAYAMKIAKSDLAVIDKLTGFSSIVKERMSSKTQVWELINIIAALQAKLDIASAKNATETNKIKKAYSDKLVVFNALKAKSKALEALKRKSLKDDTKAEKMAEYKAAKATIDKYMSA